MNQKLLEIENSPALFSMKEKIMEKISSFSITKYNSNENDLNTHILDFLRIIKEIVNISENPANYKALMELRNEVEKKSLYHLSLSINLLGPI